MAPSDFDHVFENFGNLRLEDVPRVIADQDDNAHQPANTNTFHGTLPCRRPHHELRIHYPALDLLPDDGDATINQPHGLAYRQRPDRSKYQLDQSPPDFVIKLADSSDAVPESALQGDALALFYGLSRLGQTSGAIILSVLAMNDGEGPAMWLLRRESYFGHEAGYATVRAGLRARGSGEDYCLPASDFQSLLNSGAPWVPLLDDLVSRKSDQACLYVDSVLHSSLNDYIDPEAALEEDYYDTKYARAAHKIFKARLQKIMSKHSYPADGSNRVDLPCGHWLEYRSSDITNASPEDLRDASCQICGTGILTYNDKVEIDWKQELITRQDYEDRQASWSELDMLGLGDATLRLDKATFLRAVMEAGISLRPPRSAVPKLLSLADCEVTNTSFEAIRDWMNRRYWPMEGRASALGKRLRDIVCQCLRKTTVPLSTIIVPTPPGWEKFLLIWLHRAMAFLVHRTCEEPGQEHEGVHWHDDDAHVYYNAPKGTVMSFEERALHRSMQEMETAFGEIMV